MPTVLGLPQGFKVVDLLALAEAGEDLMFLRPSIVRNDQEYARSALESAREYV
jgi:hypothetical protein